MAPATAVKAADASQEFLNESQYRKTGVLRYEFIFGHGFISTGGPHTTSKIFEQFSVPNGGKVLDVGCGIGGGAEFIARKFNAKVTGVDLCNNCIDIAQERYANSKDVSFRLANALEEKFPDNHFDMVYSRDTIIHIASKRELFKKMYDATKPGGRLLITDYCSSPHSTWDADFAAYVAQRGYALVPIEEYKADIESAGWIVDEAKDNKVWFEQVLQEEMVRFAANRDKFLADFSEQDLRDLEDGWTIKLERVRRGQQKWALFAATKPE